MLEPRGEVGRFGGRDVHWRLLEGEGPSVVLMAGCGLAMEFWRPVSGRLPGRRQLAWDRPGMGGTRWPGHLPTLAEEVATAVEILDAHGDGPAVLVAHSMAAFYAEAVARLRPDLVAGLMLVDASAEWYSSDPGGSSAGWARGVGALVRWGRLGGPAAAAWRFGTYLQSHWDWRRLGYGRLEDIYRDADAWEMATAESFAYEAQAWDLLQLRAEHPWPGLPTLVLSAEDANGGRDVASQGRLARLLGGRQVVVPRSKHLMMLDRPEVVADGVASMCR